MKTCSTPSISILVELNGGFDIDVVVQVHSEGYSDLSSCGALGCASEHQKVQEMGSEVQIRSWSPLN